MKIEQMLTEEQIAKAVDRIGKVPREVFVDIANQFTAASCTVQKIADETDGRRRLEMLFEMNEAMQRLAYQLVSLDVGP